MLQLPSSGINTHTHTHIHIYICVCVCVNTLFHSTVYRMNLQYKSYSDCRYKVCCIHLLFFDTDMTTEIILATEIETYYKQKNYKY